MQILVCEEPITFDEFGQPQCDVWIVQEYNPDIWDAMTLQELYDLGEAVFWPVAVIIGYFMIYKIFFK